MYYLFAIFHFNFVCFIVITYTFVFLYRLAFFCIFSHLFLISIGLLSIIFDALIESEFLSKLSLTNWQNESGDIVKKADLESFFESLWDLDFLAEVASLYLPWCPGRVNWCAFIFHCLFCNRHIQSFFFNYCFSFVIF